MSMSMRQYINLTPEQHEAYIKRVFGDGPSRAELRERREDEFFQTLAEIIASGSHPEIIFKVNQY